MHHYIVVISLLLPHISYTSTGFTYKGWSIQMRRLIHQVLLKSVDSNRGHDLASTNKVIQDIYTYNTRCYAVLSSRKPRPLYPVCGHIDYRRDVTTRLVTRRRWTIHVEEPYMVNMTVVRGRLTVARERCPHEYLQLPTRVGTLQKARLCGRLPPYTYTSITGPSPNRLTIIYVSTTARGFPASFYVEFQLHIQKQKHRNMHLTTVYNGSSIWQLITLPPGDTIAVYLILLTTDITFCVSVRGELQDTNSSIRGRFYDGAITHPSPQDLVFSSRNTSHLTSTTFHGLVAVDMGPMLGLGTSATLVYTSHPAFPTHRPAIPRHGVRGSTRAVFNSTNCHSVSYGFGVLCIAEYITHHHTTRQYTTHQYTTEMYLNMRLLSVYNPGYYTEDCVYSGFALVPTERLTYLSTHGQALMDHAFPVLTFCNSGTRLDRSPFPDNYTSSSSSVLLVYYAFVATRGQVAGVVQQFEMVLDITEIDCFGVFINCDQSTVQSNTEIPVGSVRGQQGCKSPYNRYPVRYTHLYNRIAVCSTQSQPPITRYDSLPHYHNHVEVYLHTGCLVLQMYPSPYRGQGCTLTMELTKVDNKLTFTIPSVVATMEGPKAQFCPGYSLQFPRYIGRSANAGRVMHAHARAGHRWNIASHCVFYKAELRPACARKYHVNGKLFS